MATPAEVSRPSDASDWRTRLHQWASMPGVHPFAPTREDEHDEAGGADPEHLEGVPDEQDDEQVEPAGAAVLDELPADGGGVEVGGGEEHARQTPFQPASGADRVAQDVGRQPSSQDRGDLLAEGPGQADHGSSPLMRVSSSERTSLRGPSACGSGHAAEGTDGAYM